MGGWLCIVFAIAFGGALTVHRSLWKKWCRWNSINWPAGPKKLPIIGNFHQLKNGGKPLYVTLAQLAREHGTTMTIWFGSWGPTIVASDHEAAWEVLVTKAQDFSSRTLPCMSKLTSANWQTLATSNMGLYWQKLRRGLHISTLNPPNISAQKQLQEEDVFNLILSLQNEASSNNGVVKPLFHFRRITIKLLGRLCFGAAFKDDIFVEGIDNVIEDTIRLSGVSGLAHVFEFSQYIPGLNRPFMEASKVKSRIEELIRPYIPSNRRSSPPCETNCYLHFLLSQDYSEEVVIFNLFEAFMLAVDSTSTATAWALAFMIHHPKIQQKLYQEISREIGPVELNKVNKLQYLHAVVKETMRMRSIAPLAVPHKAVRDSKLMGSNIVAGTPVMVNLYALQHDPNIWVKPDQFMPERFLGSCEESMERSFLPFGAGRRICPGMDLAKQQVAFTLASLVKSFHWSSAVKDELPDMTEEFTFILRMKSPLVARIVPRSC